VDLQKMQISRREIIGDPMIKLILASLFMYFCMITYCYAWFDKFDTYDYVGQGVVTGSIALDWLQTHQIATHPNQWSETNPILGKHPSVGKVNSYFIACEVGHAAISYLLPKYIEMPKWVKEYIHINKLPIRNSWQFIWFGIESGTAYNNYQGGIRIRF
jgi:hypothetical protein